MYKKLPLKPIGREARIIQLLGGRYAIAFGKILTFGRLGFGCRLGADLLGFVDAHLFGSLWLGCGFGFAGFDGGCLAGLELIYPAFDVDDALLTGEERV